MTRHDQQLDYDRETGLTNRQLLALHMEMSGQHRLGAIASQIGISVATLGRWRNLTAWQQHRRVVADQIAAARLERLVDLDTRFNLLAHDATDTLEELNKDADSDSVRLGAAKDILDRAPKAPKSVRLGEGGGNTVLQIGIGIVEGMQEAMTDIGERVPIDLTPTAGKSTPAPSATPSPRYTQPPKRMAEATEI